MRSIHRILLLLPALAIVFSSCCEDDPFSIGGIDDGIDRSRAAFVRIIHAASTAPGVVVFVDSVPRFRAIAQNYMQSITGVNEARYYPVDTAARTIEFRSESGETIVSLAPLALRKGEFYTIYFHGREGAYGVLRTTDRPLPTPGVDMIRMRTVNLVPGSPALDISFSESGPPTFEDIGYAEESEYRTFPRPNGSRGLYVFDADGNRLFGLPNAAIPQSDVVMTLVISGSLSPKGDEPFLSFALMNEAFFDTKEALYGGSHFPIGFAAVRFANLMPMGTGPNGESRSATVSLLDSMYGADYAANELFRRNFPGQEKSLLNVLPLGNRGLPATDTIRPYMLLGTLLTRRYPWRIEVGGGSVLTELPIYREPERGRGFELMIKPNFRYTIVAYGDTIYNRTESLWLIDNTRAPLPGSAAVRLFHGAYDPLNRSRRLKIRIGGGETPLMGYGEKPDGKLHAADVPGGASRIDLLDENGALVHSESLDTPLVAGETYTIYLSRGAFGTSLALTPVSEALKL